MFIPRTSPALDAPPRLSSSAFREQNDLLWLRTGRALLIRALATPNSTLVISTAFPCQQLWDNYLKCPLPPFLITHTGRSLICKAFLRRGNYFEVLLPSYLRLRSTIISGNNQRALAQPNNQSRPQSNGLRPHTPLPKDHRLLRAVHRDL